MKPMTYKELGEKVAEQALDDYLINGKTMREWINILSDNMSVLEQIRDEIQKEKEAIHFDISEQKAKWTNSGIYDGLTWAQEIIDKYREDGE